MLIYMTFIDDKDNKRLFEKIYDEYKNIMYNAAYSILKDEFLSEDAVHNAFMSISNHMKKISKISEQGDNNLRNYLIIIVKNCAFKIHNKYKKNIILDNRYNEEYIQDNKDNNNIEIDIENADSQRRLVEMIKSLDEKYSSVLILRYFYDMKNDEIASHLKITTGNVNTRLVRGRRKLKLLIEEEGIYDGQTI